MFKKISPLGWMVLAGAAAALKNILIGLGYLPDTNAIQNVVIGLMILCAACAVNAIQIQYQSDVAKDKARAAQVTASLMARLLNRKWPGNRP